LQDVKPEERCFYECIFGESSQKPYFDIDVPLKEGIYTVEKSKALVKKVLDIARSTLSQLSDYLVFSSHGPEKISYHVVFDKWCFTNYRDGKAYLKEVCDKLDEEDRQYVDASMYKSVQQFRIIGSHKYGSERVKRFDETMSTWKLSSEFPESSMFVNLYLASLITNTSYCYCLPSLCEPDEEKRTFSSVDLTDTNINSVMQLVNINEGGKEHYKILDVQGSMIMLRRQFPSYCKTCERVHEHENPFLSVCSNGGVFFNCRRSASGKSTHIGDIVLQQQIAVVKPEEKSESTVGGAAKAKQINRSMSNLLRKLRAG
jgi:hypothetical protein